MVHVKILFVEPPKDYWFVMGEYLPPPYGILQLAAYLEHKNKDAEIQVLDCNAEELDWKGLEKRIESFDPDIVASSALATCNTYVAVRTLEIAKKVKPDVLTVAGGQHFTVMAQESLETYPEIDVIVRGEGEETLAELVQSSADRRSFSHVDGISYRKRRRIRHNPPRPLIGNLDNLPFPAFHLWPIEQFKKYGKIIFPVMTSRGCTFWCDFCSAVRMFGRKYRMRSPQKVVDELEFLYRKYGEDQYTFYDDAFTVSQARTEEICNEILKRGLKIKWDCETRVDMVTKDLLQKMKDAGCIAVWFGVEAGSEQVIEAMGKGISIQQTLNAFKWANEVGLMTVASMILGFPGETRETAMESIKLLKRIKSDEIGVYIATPYPGTPMYDYVKKMGWIKITDFNKYDTATPIFETPTMSMKELRELHDEAHRRFYLRPAYIIRAFSKGGVYGYSTTKTALAWLKRTVADKLSFR